ncbi:hypothetical protein [Nocardia sp. CC227C]|uniref:hypothetical protein n=1 Tax=Nocardia sp. CC227C TaxID=3044562 RepID=UPI00278BE0BB|nr:hypothetical protein [Nocardia sp. CC227C]
MTMLVAEIDAVLAVDWLLRDLPAAALRGVARTAEAERIHRQGPITARRLAGRDGFVRYERRLRRAVDELAAIVAVVEPVGPAGRPAWEQEARAYAEIGSACMDLAYQIERRLLYTGARAGGWAVRLVHTAHQLDAYLRPGSVARLARDSYQALFDEAVLAGRGSLLPGTGVPG